MEVDLSTTNVLLGIMAGVSVLQALVLIGAGIGGFMAYRRVMQLINDLEARQIAPLREKVEGILGGRQGRHAHGSASRPSVSTRRFRARWDAWTKRQSASGTRCRQGQSGDRRHPRHPRGAGIDR